MSRAELDKLLQASKDPSTVDADIIPNLHVLHQTAEALLDEVRTGTENSEQICDDLIQALRVLRNACAAGHAVCTALLHLGSIGLLAETIDTLGTGGAALNWTLPAVVAQFLANFTNAGGPECAAAAWHRLFPSLITKLAHVDSWPAQEATALTVFTCSRTVEGAAEAMSSPEGAPLLTAMLHGNVRFASKQKSNHSLALLLGYLAFQMDALLPIFISLASSGGDIVKMRAGGYTIEVLESLPLVAAHSLLLQELAIEAQEAPVLTASSVHTDEEEEDADLELKKPSNSLCGSMACVLSLIRLLANRKRAIAIPISSSSNREESDKDEPSLLFARHQLLQDALHLVRDICARDDDGSGLTNAPNSIDNNNHPSSSSSLIDDLLTAGLIPTIPAMLKALGPISNPRR